MSSIKSIHELFEQNFRILRIVFAHCIRSNIALPVMSLEMYAKIRASYYSAVLPIMTRYFVAGADQTILNGGASMSAILEMMEDLRRTIVSHNFEHKLAVFVAEPLRQVVIERRLLQAGNLLLRYTSSIVLANQNYRCKLCHRVTTGTSLLCNHCIKVSNKSRPADSEFYDRKKRVNAYNPADHCTVWIRMILARHDIAIPPRILAAIRNECARDGVKLTIDLPCEYIRKILRRLKCTEYNNAVPLIKFKLTKFRPPDITEAELARIRATFARIKICASMINYAYHPYFIMKLLELYVEDPCRRALIMSNIHTQKRETVIDCDKQWAKMCDKLGLQFINSGL